ncbi:MAG: 3-isopropylmalate dehydratase small subunit [Gammaproteobacteria bacterium AqS3]|nr:3-isopropylmalate dehydratase small subunit [Gammaproteobacteria bacterium AqS3]
MQPFERHEGLTAPLRQDHVDTDQIIPKQFLKSIERSGFGANLFDSWRYLDEGRSDQRHTQRAINPDFILNRPGFAEASILIAGVNFGCGSSREHAVWALLDYGIRVVIAASFGDIFRQNANNNGLLTIALPEDVVQELMQHSEAGGHRLGVDLQSCLIEELSGGDTREFAIDPIARQKLLQGLDDIGLSLLERSAIEACEQRRCSTEPWVFAPLQDREPSP